MMMLRTGDLHDRPLGDTGGHGVRPYGVRIALLYLLSRRFWQSLLAIGALTLLIWWVMDRTPTGVAAGIDIAMVTARNETLLLHLASSLLASVIGIAVWSPFGETERVSPVVIPVMRAVHLLSMILFGCVAIALVIASWRDVMPGIDLVPLFLRNALFLTGLVLIAGRFLDVRLAWLLPVMLGGVTITGLLQKMAKLTDPADLWRGEGWSILALDLSHGHATAICLGVGIGAIALYIRDGVRDSAEGK
jgi:uncharacterized membrane protein YidH (DUF202 family)